MDALTLRAARADEPGVRTLLQAHFDLMRATSPEESCHVMTPETLLENGVDLFVAESAGDILGTGALKTIGDRHGELKSMHTSQAARGRGIGQAILMHLMKQAKAGGLTRLSLETGSEAPFAAARGLYEKAGFTYCAPFGDYVEDPLSVFMTREI